MQSMEALYTQWFHTLLLLAFISLTASQTRNGSDITCSTTRECQSHDITCSPNSDCTVTCSGQTSCLNTNIYGPQSNNNLTLICYVDSCRIANIYGPSDGNVYIRCKRWQSCIGITVHAESGTDYLDILVTETGDSFWGGFGIAKIYCPISQTPKSCSLRISGLTAMPRHNPSTLISSMHIYAQNGYRDIDISCEGWQSVDECFDSLHPGGVPLFFCGTSFDYACFTAPRTIEDKMATDWRCNNDTGITDDDLCSVSNTMPPGIYGSHFYCVDPFICALASGLTIPIRCNHDKDCTLRCMSHFACSKLEVHGPVNGDLDVYCSRRFTNGGNNQNICSQMKLYGPSNGDLNLLCNDTVPEAYVSEGPTCPFMIIDAQTTNTNRVNIVILSTMLGPKSKTFSSSTVKCPSNGLTDTCSIDVTASGQNVIDNLQIYAENAFYSLSLSCDYNTSAADNCYTTEPTLYCGASSSKICPLTLSTGIDGWECSDTSNWIDRCDLTKFPSQAPSKTPSKSPTKLPTMHPTPTPTISAINPSVDPTVSPINPIMLLDTTSMGNTSYNPPLPSMRSLILNIILSFVVTLCVIGVASVCLYKLYQRKKERKTQQEKAMIVQTANDSKTAVQSTNNIHKQNESECIPVYTEANSELVVDTDHNEMK
eukprot:128986_1